jgi:hypothetical protein
MSAQPPGRSCSTGDKRERFSAVDLAVRVWGMAAGGRPFTQEALLRNLNREGAVITGLFHELSVGEIIGVQYKQRKARCRVVWNDSRQADNGHAEIRLLPDQQCPWDDQLDRARSETAHMDHREYHRHQTCFPVELWSTGSSVSDENVSDRRQRRRMLRANHGACSRGNGTDAQLLAGRRKDNLQMHGENMRCRFRYGH